MTTNYKKIAREFTTTVLDRDSGEIIERTSEKVSFVKSEPEFVRVYLKDILYLSDLQTNQSGLLYALLQKMNFSNQIVLNSTIKRELSEQLKICIGTINNTLTKFKQAKILFQLGTGVYLANPYLFGRGYWNDVIKMRMQVDYTLKGRTFKAVTSRESDFGSSIGDLEVNEVLE